MRIFKINKDQKELSKKQIEKHKDFSKVRHEYERFTKRGKKPFYKDPKLFLAIILIGLVLYLVIKESK